MSKKERDKERSAVVVALWEGMPEFTQEKKAPFKELVIRFETEEDYASFQKIIGQPLTLKTKSLWHPQLDRKKNFGTFYVDE